MKLASRVTGSLLVALAAGAFASVASAAVVLSTDFNARTVAGATASNLNWTTNGVADAGALTAVANPGPPAAELFDTSAAQGRFAVDLNLHNESAWRMDVALDVLGGKQIDLGVVSLDAFIFNNAGALQTVYRDLDMTLQLLDSTLAVLDQASFSNIFPADGSPALQPVNLGFDLSGNTLLANTGYTLRLLAEGQGQGNNSGIDNFTVNGVVRDVPEPSSLALVLAAAGGLLAARRRKSA